jgi:hypothetical protein
MTISKELLDELLKGCERPEDLLGDAGLMKELRIKLMERMLGAELTAHLGYEDGKDAPAGQANRRGGRTVQPFGISVEWEIEGMPMNDGKNFCGRINSVTFTAGDTPPQIWISPELQDDCLREVALEHERQHVGFFYDYLDDITAALPREVEAFNRSNAFLGPASGLRNTLETAVNDIRNKIERANTNAVDRLVGRNESIDTPEAYDQLSSICQ